MKPLDPVTLAVLNGRLVQIADEMDATLFRSAFNPIIAEAHDACHGLYHAETGATLPREPVMFLKAPDTVVGPYDDVLIPRRSGKTDWEVELAVVIGRTARYLESDAEALAWCLRHGARQEVLATFLRTPLSEEERALMKALLESGETHVESGVEILVAAAGKPQLIGAEMIRPGATVIDVGTNRTDEGLVGDVDFEAAREVAGAITPVPGGVGPMTIAMLLANTVQAARLRHQIAATSGRPT